MTDSHDRAFPDEFLWGASTSPHQIEGNNVNSDWWAKEQLVPGMQASGDAVDSYHRYREDMQLLAGAGLNAYRFGIEWARIEPFPGVFSNAELAHYRRMIDSAIGMGITPVITLNHFSTPRWFAEDGGWLNPLATERFAAYVTKVTEILDGVEWVITMNEPNMLAMMVMLEKSMRESAAAEWQTPTMDAVGDGDERERIAANPPIPTVEFGRIMVDAHHAARDIVRARTGAKVGCSIANGAFTAAREHEEKLAEVRYAYEDLYLDAADGDDFVGVQAYRTQQVDADGVVPTQPDADDPLLGAGWRPEALAMAVRHVSERTGKPILITENGLDTADDERRIRHTDEALSHLLAAIDDGADVRGYLHWSLLDNFEWGHWGPTFGLIAVDRDTFVRSPKPSLAWLGGIAGANAI